MTDTIINPLTHQKRLYTKDYTPLNDLYDPKTNDLPISPELQSIVNIPPVNPNGINETDQEYLKKVMDMIDTRKINLLAPRTLLNIDIYEKLDPQQELKVDMNTQALMARLREIHTLWQLDEVFTYQIQNLIASVRDIKSRVEEDCGDVYVI